jgi:hypothetical protein
MAAHYKDLEGRGRDILQDGILAHVHVGVGMH